MAFPRKRICLHCRTYFRPDPRNARNQKYCSRPECRKASKAASQKKWLNKPENCAVYGGAENVKRVQLWRKQNPGYWRRPGKRKKPLQEDSSLKTTTQQSDPPQTARSALQDFIINQPAVLWGLLAHLTGSALQDDIAVTARHMQQLGEDILHQPCKGGHHVNLQATDLSPPHPSSS
jgi:hypothetical protein